MKQIKPPYGYGNDHGWWSKVPAQVKGALFAVGCLAVGFIAAPFMLLLGRFFLPATLWWFNFVQTLFV